MKKSISLIFICLTLVFTTGQTNKVKAPNILLDFPLRCTIDKDCWILAYPDLDSSEKWKDYKGGNRTYNTHKGTDFVIKNQKRMNYRVPVVAAANGKVIGTRNGVRDINVKKIGKRSVDKIECGNRVAIYHGQGLLTDYCHMLNGSIAVKKGDYVKAGDLLGYVGMSGLTETPHLHFGVQYKNKKIDPFTGKFIKNWPIQGLNRSLWKPEIKNKLKYHPAFIYNIGITSQVPNKSEIQEGNFEQQNIKNNSKFIYIWADTLSIKRGDVLSFTLKDPLGRTLINKKSVIDRPNVRRFFYLTHNRNSKNLELGKYSAKVKIYRPAKQVSYKKILDFYVVE